MLRSSRTIASLIRCLMLGTAATVASATLATTLVGCKDESQPEYWVDKLDDPTWRPRAVKRLEQFFEDAVTKANNDLTNAEVQTLLTKTLDPLTKCYVEHYADLDTKTRVSLIKLLGSFNDKRVEPAVKKAFDEFAKRPQTNKEEQDIKWAALAAGGMKLNSVAAPMLDSFDKLRASSMLGGITYRDLNEAMVDIADKSWVGALNAKLDAPIVQPKGPKDKDLIDPYRDQQFWQTTAAKVLGFIGDPSSVEPLIKVMLDPAKADIQATALLALVKIGKPSVDAAVKLLNGSDDKMIAYSNRRYKEVTGEDPKDNPHVATAALILGTVGRQEGIAPLVAALKKTDNEVNKAVIARELAKIPPTTESKDAFKAAYESISLDTVIPPGSPALEMLTESAGQFYDPGLSTWLLDRAEATKGVGEGKKSLQSAITVVVLKLAKPDQLADAKKAVDKYGTQLEKDLYAQVETLVKACGDRTSCYLTALEKSENQEQAKQFTGIKASYMLGILGNEQTRDEIITRLDSIENAAVRFTAAQAIDHLSPKGGKDASAKLLKIINTNEKSADRDKAAADEPLKQVMYRLDARGG